MAFALQTDVERYPTMSFSRITALKLFVATGGVLFLVAFAPHDTDRGRAHVPSLAAGGGCKSVATFTSSAGPELRKEGCLGCHAGGEARATNALDLTGVGKDDAAACAQALKKVNLASKPQSAIIQAATGAQPHAGGKVSDPASFSAALLGWINNE